MKSRFSTIHDDLIERVKNTMSHAVQVGAIEKFSDMAKWIEDDKAAQVCDEISRRTERLLPNAHRTICRLVGGCERPAAPAWSLRGLATIICSSRAVSSAANVLGKEEFHADRTPRSASEDTSGSG